MKIKMGTIETSSSTEFQNTAFDIGNKAVIMDILRGKMYSNPIKIICQEIMCNARDAHREVRKHDVPIEVKLPTTIDNTYCIRDYGPGITPERMSEIFVMYGESSKRNTNAQTGGFGLGSKTPFSYTDTFSVISITPDSDGNLIERKYVAYIDDSRLGVMSLVQESPATEQRGTKIIIPVKNADFNYFKEYTVESTKHWPVKPIIVNDEFVEWPKIDIYKSGNGWFIGRENRGHFAIVDGIEYPINTQVVQRDEKDGLFNKMGLLSVYMEFKTGEVDVVATRENLDYSPKTNRKIKKSFEQFMEEFKIKLIEDVETMGNLRQAVIEYSNQMRVFSKIVDIHTKWNGIELEPIRRNGIKMSYIDESSSVAVEKSLAIECRQYEPHNYFSNVIRDEVNTVKKTDVTINYLPVLEDVLICEDDTENERCKQRIVTLFAENKKIKKVLMVRVDDELRKRLIDNYYYDKIGVQKISSYEPTIEKRKTIRRSCSVGKIKKLWNNTWMDAIPSDYMDGKNKSIVVIINKKPYISCGDSYRQIDNSQVISLSKKIRIFGVLKKFVKKIGPEWTILSDESLSTLAESLEQTTNISTYLKYGRKVGKLGDIFTPVNAQEVADHSFFRTVVDIQCKMDGSFFLDVDFYEALCRTSGRKTPMAYSIEREVFMKYPLLERFRYEIVDSTLKNDLLLYVRAKDEQMKKEKENAIS